MNDVVAVSNLCRIARSSGALGPVQENGAVELAAGETKSSLSPADLTGDCRSLCHLGRSFGEWSSLGQLKAFVTSSPCGKSVCQ